MPRDIPIGNGSLFVSYDTSGLVREFYFPHVGEECHSSTEPFRFGVWVDGSFSWIPDGWRVKSDYLDDSLVTHIELTNERQKVRIIANDLIDFHENIYLR